jgi:replicative DNA helicase
VTSKIPGYITTPDFLNKIWETYEEQEQNPELYRPAEQVISELTRLTGGYSPKTYHVIGSPPGGGKTSLMISEALYHAKKHLDPNTRTAVSIFVSNEMGEEQLGRAVLANLASIDRTKMREFDLDGEEKQRAKDALQHIASSMGIMWAWFVGDNVQLDALVEKVQDDFGIAVDFVYLDYLHLMQYRGVRKRAEQIENLNRHMKMLANKKDLTVIAGAQLKQEAIKNKSWGSMWSFLYGGFDKAADTAIIIAPHLDDNDTPQQHLRDVHIVKVREGRGLGEMITVGFRGEHSAFASLAKDEQYQDTNPDIVDALRWVA